MPINVYAHHRRIVLTLLPCSAPELCLVAGIPQTPSRGMGRGGVHIKRRAQCLSLPPFLHGSH